MNGRCCHHTVVLSKMPTVANTTNREFCDILSCFLGWNGVLGARNEITRILNFGSAKVEPKFNIRFHEVWTQNSGPKFDLIARTNAKCH